MTETDREQTPWQARDNIKAELRHAEEQAWIALSRGKYAMFGYWAAWVVILSPVAIAETRRGVLASLSVHRSRQPREGPQGKLGGPRDRE